MKNYFIVLLIVMFTAKHVSAQKSNSYDYKNAVGVKFYPGAITIKHFFNSNIAVEGISYFYGTSSIRFTGLIEFHFDITTVPGLKWYIGPGAHVSFAKYKSQANTFVGIDGILGLDYKFKAIPLNLSADWTPSFFLNGDLYYSSFRPGYGAVSVRYVLK